MAQQGATEASPRVPAVSYLVLDDGPPRLEANRCAACGAVYFDRRVACAACSSDKFERVSLPDGGKLHTFTIVHRSAPGVPAPYVSGIVELDDGTWVRTTVRNVEPDPAAVRLGMPVRLCTFTAAVAEDGTEAVAFAFEPVEVA